MPTPLKISDMGSVSSVLDTDTFPFIRGSDNDKATLSQMLRSVRKTFDVVDYGADPTGLTDSTAAILATIAAIPATGGVLEFTHGTYLHTGFTLPANVALLGQGFNATTIRYTPATGDGITINGRWISICGVGLDSNASGGSTGWAIKSTAAIVGEFDLDKFHITGFRNGIDLGECINCRIGHGRLEAPTAGIAGTFGIRVGNTGLSTIAKIEDAYLIGYETGVRNVNCYDLVCNMVAFEAHTTAISLSARTTMVGCYWEPGASITTHINADGDGVMVWGDNGSLDPAKIVLDNVYAKQRSVIMSNGLYADFWKILRFRGDTSISSLTGTLTLQGTHSSVDVSGFTGSDLRLAGEPTGIAGKGLKFLGFNAAFGWTVSAQILNTAAGAPNFNIVDGRLQLSDGVNIITSTGSNGTIIGETTAQRVGFHGATATAQAASTADLRSVLISKGFVAAGGATPLNLNGGALTANTVVVASWVTDGTVNMLRSSGFGYNPSTYKVTQVGSLGVHSGLSLGVDVSANAGGAFNGDEVIIPQGRNVIAPNAANTAYLGVLGIDSANRIRIGATTQSVQDGSIANMVITIDGANRKIGFLGAPEAAQQTGGAATAGGTYTAAEQTMVQKAYDALRTFGLLS